MYVSIGWEYWRQVNKISDEQALRIAIGGVEFFEVISLR
jgi:hypothetical protein